MAAILLVYVQLNLKTNHGSHVVSTLGESSHDDEVGLKLVQPETPTFVNLTYAQRLLHTQAAQLLARNDTKVVFVVGGPGSGKGTQCTRLSQDHGVTHLSTGDLFRAELASDDTSLIKRVMQQGKLVPDEITVEVLLKGIVTAQSGSGGVYLIDGFPRTLEQARMFERLVPQANIQVLYYALSADTMH